ncbi:hypothetical protein BKA67DRAFT_530056 [Truncatella angustata]|uniref:DUF6594 domain-containing protein n=1 Tax=Truncatella angustata TaxID=152316 RepID=A0A9P8UX14_9PEZI|nr:uncharacterized protein BKA67DRAFT_530056 [Truncatella angustata]KAH6659935.1 hypothetical protein BKA67DRAFT_530056 [Truncatella angustata]
MENQTTSLDIELGIVGSTSVPTEASLRELFTSQISRRVAQFRKFSKNFKSPQDSKKKVQIEDYRRGYPRFSALMASHGSFHVFRRFTHLRVRLLLMKQNKLSILEKKLDKIDHDEPSPMFLASHNMDQSAERAAVLSEIEEALVVYGSFKIQARNLENWLEGNPCIAREETKFLSREEDLLTVAAVDDGVLHWLEHMVSTVLTSFDKWRRENKSDDSLVHVFPQNFTDKATRVLLTPLVIFLLLTPVVICNAMSNSTSRVIILVMAAIAFITALSLSTKSKPIDLITCSAT